MMQITPKLLERMAQQRVLKLAEALTHEFHARYPKRCRVLGNNNLDLFCKRCALDAYRYGAQSYGEIKAYALLAWYLGIGFASDPFYHRLNVHFITKIPFSDKVEKTTAYLFREMNPQDTKTLRSYTQALDKLLRVNLEKISTLQNHTQIAKVLKAIYPQRVEQLGGIEHISNALALACEEKTIRYNIQHPIGIFIYGAMCFFLGSAIDNDPLYPWAHKYLNSKEPNMASKIETLIKVTRKRIKKEKSYLVSIQKEIEHG